MIVTPGMETAVSGPPLEANQSQDRLGTIKAAHYELLTAYAERIGSRDKAGRKRKRTTLFCPTFYSFSYTGET